MVKQIETTFTGTGEMDEFEFSLLKRGSRSLIYSVVHGNHTHFEVFLIKQSPVCLDFEKRLYSETDFKEVYPKAKDFGVWAWNYTDINKAENKFKELEHESK